MTFLRPQLSILLLGPGGAGLGALPRMLTAALGHTWVASYQVGFGPPLVRSSARLRERLLEARGAFDKLAAYLDVCVLDETERQRLVVQHRLLTVRRLGAVDAETLDELSAEALDLELRLHHPVAAPAAARMSDAPGVPVSAPPDELTGRFVVRLADPAGSRFLHHHLLAGVPEDTLVLELRAPVSVRTLFVAFADALVAEGKAARRVLLEAPLPHAKTSTDGERV